MWKEGQVSYRKLTVKETLSLLGPPSNVNDQVVLYLSTQLSTYSTVIVSEHDRQVLYVADSVSGFTVNATTMFSIV